MYKLNFLFIYLVLSVLLYFYTINYSIILYNNSTENLSSSKPFYTFYGSKRIELKDTNYSIQAAHEKIEKSILQSLPHYVREKVANNLQLNDRWDTYVSWVNVSTFKLHFLKKDLLSL